MQISERDWKIFRKKIPGWQERYMERLEMEYIALLQNEKSASSKFWELEKRIKQDKKSPGGIIDILFPSYQQHRFGGRCRNGQSNLFSSFRWQESGL